MNLQNRVLETQPKLGKKLGGQKSKNSGFRDVADKFQKVV